MTILTNSTVLTHPDAIVPYPLRFWLLLISLLLSACCSIFILFHLLADRAARHALHNHVIIVLLINNLVYQFIDIPLLVHYYRTGSVAIATPAFCLFWVFGDETLFSLSLVLVAGATVQRHILIFNSQWLVNRRKRFLIHYLPIFTIAMYDIVFHTFTILFPPCKNTFDYSLPLCGHPMCLYRSEFLSMWDIIFNEIVPTLIIVTFGIALLIRVIRQKRRALQHVEWRKHRKMTIQILSISSLYFFLYIPMMSIEIFESCCKPTDIGNTLEVIIEFLAYYVMLLFPFVNLLSLPNLKTKFKRLIKTKNRRIRPIREIQRH